MLAVGDLAPEFVGTTHRGETLSLTTLRGRPAVLYFYPRAGTTGCTMEANEFARHYAEFERAGVALVGVSVDSLEAQQRFAEKCQLPFPLVADADRTIARKFGALGLLGLAKRVTFWIGADGRIEEVISGMMPAPHVRGALERLARSGRGAAPT
ncbi:MAG TPA: peroxiredoxin [Thermoplasmata archaeon]|nr:peroxiredoxin [Thermoplasmata archaeon]